MRTWSDILDEIAFGKNRGPMTMSLHRGWERQGRTAYAYRSSAYPQHEINTHLRQCSSLGFCVAHIYCTRP